MNAFIGLLMCPLGVLHQPGSRAPSSAGPGPGGGGPPSRLARVPRCCTIAPGPGAARRRRGPSASSAAEVGEEAAATEGRPRPTTRPGPRELRSEELGAPAQRTAGGGQRLSLRRVRRAPAAPRKLRPAARYTLFCGGGGMVPPGPPQALLAASCSAAARARRSPPRRLPVSFSPRGPAGARTAPPPRRLRAAAARAGPPRVNTEVPAWAAAGPRLALGRRVTRCWAENPVFASPNRWLPVRGGAGRSRVWDWGCRMRSVSFLRLGAGAGEGVGGADYASPLAPKAGTPPRHAFEILVYSRTPAARWDLRPLLFRGVSSDHPRTECWGARLRKAP